MEFWKKNGLQLLTLALCAVLLAVVVQQGKKLEDMENYLDYAIDTQDRVLENIRGVSDYMGHTVAGAMKLMEGYTLTPIGVEADTHSLLMELSLSLREWWADTQVTLLLTVEEQTTEISMTPAGNGAFIAPVAVPVERGAVTMDLRVLGGGSYHREHLDSWDDGRKLLPIQRSGFGGARWACENDRLVPDDGNYVEFSSPGGERIRVTDPVYRLYRNGRLVAEQPGKWPGDCTYMSGAWPEDISCKHGDTILLTLVCRDDYGLTYEFDLEHMTARTSGEMETEWRDEYWFPTLTWPE